MIHPSLAIQEISFLFNELASCSTFTGLTADWSCFRASCYPCDRILFQKFAWLPILLALTLWPLLSVRDNCLFDLWSLQCLQVVFVADLLFFLC